VLYVLFERQQSADVEVSPEIEGGES
jgi:hypothetical protein